MKNEKDAFDELCSLLRQKSQPGRTAPVANDSLVTIRVVGSPKCCAQCGAKENNGATKTPKACS